MTKNQHGYTMLLAIGCLLIVTILGLSLMRITSQTYTKNESREDHIQADALATKGADYLVAELNYLLEKEATAIKTKVKAEADEAYKASKEYDGYGELKKRLNAALDNILEKFSCDNAMFMGASAVNNIDKYGYCVKLNNLVGQKPPILDDDPLTWYTVEVENTDGLQRIVALRSKGDVGEGAAEANLYIRKLLGITLGSKTEVADGTGSGTGGTGSSTTTTETITESLSNQADIPVALQYALSTKKSGFNNEHQEDGAVFLHGGIDIYGGLNIDGNLYVGNYGMPGYNSYIYSSYPRVFEHQKGLTYDSSLSLRNPGTVNVSGDVLSWTKLPDYKESQHNKYVKTPSDYKDKYGLTESKSSYGFSNTGVNIKSYNTEAQDFDVNFNELKTRVKKAFETKKIIAKNCGLNDFKTAFVNCNNSLKITKSESGLLLPKLKASQNLEERGGVAYLKGLTIEYAKNVKLQGTYFIDGDFILNNGSILTDAVIYVTGEVKIDSSDINSLDYELDGKSQQGTLLIFSNKTIDINGISINSPTPSNMKAFLYSKQDIEITGSTSHVLINGGISARSIELTGMRGPDSDHNKSVWQSGCSNITQLKYCQSIPNLMTLWNYYADPEYNVKAQKQIEALQKEIDTANNKITELYNQIVNLQNQISSYKKQITDLNNQISSIEKQLKQWGLSSKKKKELESQKSSLVEQRTKIENLKKQSETEKVNLESQKKSCETQIANYKKEKAELEKPADIQTATIEKHMRSRLTVYYNPDIIITYEQHAVKPAEIPDFTIALPTDYDRIKK